MHLHFYVKNILLEYASVFVFLCFRYERFNDIFGAYHFNHHDTTIQWMTKFTTVSQIRNTSDLNFDCFQLLKCREKDINIHSPWSLLKLKKLKDEVPFTGGMLDFDGWIKKLCNSKVKLWFWLPHFNQNLSLLQQKASRNFSICYNYYKKTKTNF